MDKKHTSMKHIFKHIVYNTNDTRNDRQNYCWAMCGIWRGDAPKNLTWLKSIFFYSSGHMQYHSDTLLAGL